MYSFLTQTNLRYKTEDDIQYELEGRFESVYFRLSVHNLNCGSRHFRISPAIVSDVSKIHFYSFHNNIKDL